jgi:hypothetical protein
MSLESLLIRQPRRKVFVSYHHTNDKQYYEQFMGMFDASYEVVADNSVRNTINSDNSDYVIRAIRERYITGSSCTIVLCGPHTPWRKFVDWEIKATLDAQHALIGVLLPNCPRNPEHGLYLVPDRLHDNIESGYALWESWPTILGAGYAVKHWIEAALARPKHLIRNNRMLMSCNGTSLYAQTSPLRMPRPPCSKT